MRVKGYIQSIDVNFESDATLVFKIQEGDLPSLVEFFCNRCDGNELVSVRGAEQIQMEIELPDKGGEQRLLGKCRMIELDEYE